MRPPFASPTARRRCSTARMRTRKNRSAVTSSSMPRISTPRSPGLRAARPRVTAWSKCARSGRCSEHAPMSFPEDDDARRTADAVARRSYGKLVAFLAARTRDVAAAEDALAEAFASALVDWPAHGCPKNPEGWLLTVARRKLIDSVRRRQTGEAASTQLQILAEGLEDAAAQAEKDMQIPD